MGIFSSIGKVVGGFFGGPLGSGAGSALGGLLDDKKDRSNQRKYDAQEMANYRQRLVWLREDAEKGGFHPLEALHGGALGGMPSGTRPRVMSQSAAIGGFDKLNDVLSGDYARERNREDMRDELLRIDIDNARRTGRLGRVGGATFPADSNLDKSSDPVRGALVPDDKESGRQTTTVMAPDHKDGSWANPRSPDAETLEARGGGAAEHIGGALVSMTDAAYNSMMRRYVRKNGMDAALKVHNDYAKNLNKSLLQIMKEHRNDNFRRPEMRPDDLDTNVTHRPGKLRPQTVNPIPDNDWYLGAAQ